MATWIVRFRDEESRDTFVRRVRSDRALRHVELEIGVSQMLWSRRKRRTSSVFKRSTPTLGSPQTSSSRCSSTSTP